MPPLADPITLRLPDDLLERLDVAIAAGTYPNRSEGMREILEKGLTPPKEVQLSDVPWFVLPLIEDNPQLPLRKASLRQTVGLRVDPMAVRGPYIPFGIFCDDAEADRFEIVDAKIGGSPDLTEDRPSRLSIARETSWKSGLPRLLFTRRPLPVCVVPNTTLVTVRPLEAPPSAGFDSTRIANALQRRLTVYDPTPGAPEAESLEESSTLTERRLAVALQLARQQSVGAMQLRTLGELLGEAGISAHAIHQLLQSRVTPFRIGVYAVDIAHKEALEALMRQEYEPMRELSFTAYRHP